MEDTHLYFTGHDKNKKYVLDPHIHEIRPPERG